MMTDLSPQSEINQYTHPDLWGGHELGDGDAILHTDATVEKPSIDMQALRDTRAVLHQKLPLIASVFPIESYRSGMTFNAAAQPLGALVLAKSHYLRRTTHDENRRYEISENAALFEYEPTMTANLGQHEGYPHIISGEGLRYMCLTQWGVVVDTKSGERTVALCAQAPTVRTSGSSVRLASLVPYGLRTETEIGKTDHLGFTDNNEYLEKMSLLYVCGYGKPAKRRRTIRQLATSVIPRPIITGPSTV